MKKYFYLLLLALMPIAFTSCGDEEEDTEPKEDTILVGREYKCPQITENLSYLNDYKTSDAELRRFYTATGLYPSNLPRPESTYSQKDTTLRHYDSRETESTISFFKGNKAEHTKKQTTTYYERKAVKDYFKCTFKEDVDINANNGNFILKVTSSSFYLYSATSGAYSFRLNNYVYEHTYYKVSSNSNMGTIKAENNTITTLYSYTYDEPTLTVIFTDNEGHNYRQYIDYEGRLRFMDGNFYIRQ